MLLSFLESNFSAGILKVLGEEDRRVCGIVMRENKT